MTKICRYLAVLTLLAGGAAAYAQWGSQHYAGESFTAPDKLFAVGEKITPIKSVYYVRSGGFGYEYLTPEQARIKVPVGFVGPVFVGYESKLLNDAIKAALVQRGVRIAETREEAALAIFGDGNYVVTLRPYLMRRLALNKVFDEQSGKGVSIVDAESHKTSKGEAVLSLSTSAIGAVTKPAEFIGRLLTATMDLSGATSRMEKAVGWNEKQRQEQSFTLGDCYDNTTRDGSCEPGTKRNMAFSMRTRFQYVDLRTFVTINGERQKPFNIIARIIDDRTETRDDLPELLTSVVAELLAGFPVARAPADAAAAQSVTEQVQDDSAKTN